MLKALSNVRELRDVNLAAAIKYATVNGAKVINLSLGKPFSFDKKSVDEAVKYAMSKDVLIIHAAGNDGKNLDDVNNKFFPNKYYSDSSGEAEAWITVGASNWKDDSMLVASFSNFGKKSVDVFAPGVQIYSCIPGSKYLSSDGTSAAAPIVSGLAVLIREYYPKLTAVQVREIILRSVVRVKHNVIVNGNKIPFNDVCASGGIVNIYNALKLAGTY